MNWASRLSALSIRCRPVGAPVINPGVDRDGRRHSRDRRSPRCRPGRRQPGGRARQTADGQAARDAAGRRGVRSPGVGLRGIHGQDCAREPASELADFFEGFRKTPLLLGTKRASTSSSPVSGLVVGAAVLGARRAGGAPDVARPGVLSPGARRPERRDVHHSQVPDDARGCGSRHGPGLGRGGRRPAHHARRTDSCAGRASMSSRSCGTCCAAT